MKHTIGFALCGSFCTHENVLKALQRLSEQYEIIPILSTATEMTDTRFGEAKQREERITEICARPPLRSITDVEPIGPKKLIELLVIAPCTGNTLAKIAAGIADGPVTLACKSHLRNAGPVLVGISTNDGLGAAAENIGRLLNRRCFYFIPFRQDDPKQKPNSLVADWNLLPAAIEAALQGRQLQPVLL